MFQNIYNYGQQTFLLIQEQEKPGQSLSIEVKQSLLRLKEMFDQTPLIHFSSWNGDEEKRSNSIDPLLNSFGLIIKNKVDPEIYIVINKQKELGYYNQSGNYANLFLAEFYPVTDNMTQQTLGDALWKLLRHVQEMELTLNLIGGVMTPP